MSHEQFLRLPHHSGDDDSEQRVRCAKAAVVRRGLWEALGERAPEVPWRLRDARSEVLQREAQRREVRRGNAQSGQVPVVGREETDAVDVSGLENLGDGARHLRDGQAGRRKGVKEGGRKGGMGGLEGWAPHVGNF